jgi:hypothetical protein
MRLLLAIACLAATSLAQTVRISDDTPKGSPVSLKGTWTFDPKNPDNMACSITGHNQYNRSIITYFAHLKYVKPSGESNEVRIRRDYFFKQDDLAGSFSDFPLTVPCDELGGGKSWPPVIYTPAPPEVPVKTVFVQFDDGSSWGDSQVAADVMRERMETLAYLRELKAAYTTGGSEALVEALQVEALQQDQPTRTADKRMEWHLKVFETEVTLRYLLAEFGLQAVQDRIESSLARAEVHKTALMKP